MILLQATDNNTDTFLSLSYSRTAHVHCDRANNNTAAVKRNKTPILDW